MFSERMFFTWLSLSHSHLMLRPYVHLHLLVCIRWARNIYICVRGYTRILALIEIISGVCVHFCLGFWFKTIIFRQELWVCVCRYESLTHSTTQYVFFLVVICLVPFVCSIQRGGLKRWCFFLFFRLGFHVCVFFSLVNVVSVQFKSIHCHSLKFLHGSFLLNCLLLNVCTAYIFVCFACVYWIWHCHRLIFTTTQWRRKKKNIGWIVTVCSIHFISFHLVFVFPFSHSFKRLLFISLSLSQCQCSINWMKQSDLKM